VTASKGLARFQKIKIFLFHFNQALEEFFGGGQNGGILHWCRKENCVASKSGSP
jgi:hypothetical protein